MSTSITDYVCNLIAGRKAISDLYYAVDRSREQRSQGKTYCYKASFPGIGNKTYKGFQLVELDDRSLCCSLNSVLAQVDGVPTMDQYVLILLKARNEFRNLYQARTRALYIRSQSKIFCYNFNNPLGAAAGVNRNCLTFKNATNFLTFFCQCERTAFDPLLVINGLLLNNLDDLIV